MAIAERAADRSVRDQVSPEEWEIRVDLAAVYRLIHNFGWDDLVFTHASARVPGEDGTFLINPFGLLFEEITASSLVKVDRDGNTVLDSEYEANSAGFVIHGGFWADVWQRDVMDWVREDMKLRSQVYDIGNRQLSYRYLRKNLPLVKKRIVQGGVRLAGLLNSIFDPAGS